MAKNKTPYPSDFNRKENSPEYFAEKVMGFMGRMIGSSKSIYRYDNPENVIVFNANLATRKDGKIWYGDLDLTKDHEKLMELVSKIGVFYIFYESDLRFGKEEKPDFKLALGFYDKDGFTSVGASFDIDENDKGAPVLKKKMEVDKPEEQVSSYENEQLKFEEIKIPKLSDLKVKKGTSAWGAFQEAMIAMYGLEKMKEIYSKLYVSSKDNDFINKLNEKSVKAAYPGMHVVKVQQAVAMDNLQMACMDFRVDPTWVKPGVGYIKK